MPKTLITMWIAVLFAMPFSTSTMADRIQLPDLGDPAESALSLAREKEIGQQIMQQIRDKHVMVDDIIVQEYISSLGHLLASNADGALHDFTFFVIGDQSINAFALPGGYIGVNAGLISTTDDESELAAVVAHEIWRFFSMKLATTFTVLAITKTAGAVCTANLGSGSIAESCGL